MVKWSREIVKQPRWYSIERGTVYLTFFIRYLAFFFVKLPARQTPRGRTVRPELERASEDEKEREEKKNELRFRRE